MTLPMLGNRVRVPRPFLAAPTTCVKNQKGKSSSERPETGGKYLLLATKNGHGALDARWCPGVYTSDSIFF